uniref:Metallophosphatase/phosphoesterase n=1 Tax=Mimivirus LCMiAC01 TaxID=2506608 RepID=A0A481YZU8_9VIRU|nr:MAG: metallophosphatase/phosphoesterase [Mimivirus LCMiAC01]
MNNISSISDDMSEFTSDTEFINKIFENIDNNDIPAYDKKEFKKDCPDSSYIATVIPIKKNPQKEDEKTRIVVIGDLHGDLELTKKILDIAKIAKFKGNKPTWIGKKGTYVVQLGDQIDRCRPYKYKCDHPLATKNDEASDEIIIDIFTDLNKQAIKKGGMVISLNGNHELMNALGKINFVSYENLRKYDGSPEEQKQHRKDLYKPGGKYGKILACTRLSVVIIGDFLFVHGGIIPKFTKNLKIKNRKDLYKINYIVRKWLLGQIDSKNISNIINQTKDTMFWNRIMGHLPSDSNKNPEKIKKKIKKCIKYLDPVLRLFKVGNMIIGHTPQWLYNGGINSTCGKRVWRVDTGSSKAFNEFDDEYHETGIITDLRNAQALEILNNEEINILM